MSKKMTIWGVRYRMFGVDYSGIRWFDSKEKAESFYNFAEYVDKPFHLTYDENTAKKLIWRSDEIWNYMD